MYPSTLTIYTSPFPLSLPPLLWDYSLLLPMLLPLLLLVLLSPARSATFTFVNKCADTVWPGILSNSGSAPLGSTGFSLPPSTFRSFQAPSAWSGRFWARTSCSLDPSSHRFSCLTADCGSGRIECDGAGASPPATLAEFTLSSGAGQDFYDVSLVDGYNLPMLVEPSSAGCASTGCVADLNQMCPAELRVVGEGVEACRSACEAFGKPEFCCSGEYGSPATCRPTAYSAVFKTACPKSYSYAYDDATSTFTCAGADYTITFCPDSTRSQKSTSDPSRSTPTPSTPKATGGVMLEDDSWLASLATGDSTSSSPRRSGPFLQQAPLIIVVISYALLNFLVL